MIVAAIVGSSLAGSLHCGAMCGPLVGLYGPASVRLALVHALGRLATYVGLGVAAGAVGRAIDLAGDLGAVQHVASILAAIAIVVWGVRAMFVGIDPQKARGDGFKKGLVQIRRVAPARRMFATGLLTGLLPCGWLWAFVVMAAGTGEPLQGGAVMLAFWLGTVPMMLGVMTALAPLLARVRTKVPRATAIVLIAIGLGTLAFRWRDAGATQVAHPHCHCHDMAERPA